MPFAVLVDDVAYILPLVILLITEIMERVWLCTSSVSAHAEVRPNNSEFFCGTQNVSAQSNLHHWWVHTECQDGGVNKPGSSTSKYLVIQLSLCIFVSPKITKQP